MLLTKAFLKNPKKQMSVGKARDVVQWVRILIAFSEDLDLNPSNHMAGHYCFVTNSRFMEFVLFGFLDHCPHVPDTHADKTQLF